MPEEDAVRAYLKGPGKKTTLTVGQQVLAMDKLLEDAEVNFRTICDMVRYQNMKEAGMVHSVDEFLQLLRSGRTQNEYLSSWARSKSRSPTDICRGP